MDERDEKVTMPEELIKQEEEIIEEPVETQEIPGAAVEVTGEPPLAAETLPGADTSPLEAEEAGIELRDEAAEEAEAGEGEEESEEAAEERRRKMEGAAWYVVHSYSGYENKVKKNLEQRIESMGMQDKIFGVVVPTEEEVELRDGQRHITERRIYPGYILVHMIMTDESWYVVRNTPDVTGFVSGEGSKPTPLRDDEVEKIMKRMEAEAPKIKVSFRTGEKVRIIEGPFEDFMGTVDDINTEKGKVRVLVSFFGRETPIELDFLQVERV
jgi:transcriptional antiterminator NusG